MFDYRRVSGRNDDSINQNCYGMGKLVNVWVYGEYTYNVRPPR